VTKWAAVVLAAVSLAACTKSTSSAASPTSPATKTTDTFNGAVPVKSSDMHSFTVSAAGQVDITLTSTTPAGAALGLSVGTAAASGCSAVAGGSVVASAGSVAQLSGVLSPATYCVALFDIGGQSQPVSYTVTVVHP